VRRYLLLYALIFVALGVVIAVAARREAREGAPPVPSTYILGPEGYRAAWRLLELSGVPVRRHLAPLDDLPGGQGNLLIVAAPRARPVTELEANSLRAWISSGNSLLWLTAQGDPLTYDPDVTGRRRVLESVREAEARLEWALGVSLDPGDPKREDPEPLERYLPAVPGTALTENVDQVYVGPCMDLGIAGQGWDPVAGTLQGVSIQVRRLGSGRIWLVPTPHLLDNRSLERADNVALLRNVVREELGRGGVVLFDEYHHGYTPSPLAAVPRAPAFRAFLFQGALLLGLYLWARGRRFGPPVPLERDERRPAVEYLHAMAAILRRGGKTREVAGDLVRGFRHRLEARAGIPARLTDPQAVARLGRRTGRDCGGLGVWLEQARQGRVDRPRHLFRLARALRAAERSVEVRARGRRS
jgi:hypothetical protein